jgi:alkylhydroperoxidase family enzyme
MQAGAAIEKIQNVPRFRESPLFNERERVALEFAERMTITGEKVDDELFARVRSHFSEAETVELAAAAALENFRSKFNTALGIEAQGFCVLPVGDQSVRPPSR